MTLLDRFIKNTVKVGDCLEWVGSQTKKGYGKIQMGSRKDNSRRTRAAHVVAYEMVKGPVPAGLQVQHSCDNPACVNPEHLSLGTNSKNQKDSYTRGRRSSKGSQNSRATMTEVEVKRIKQLLLRKSCSAVARITGKGLAAIYHIKAGHTWQE